MFTMRCNPQIALFISVLVLMNSPEAAAFFGDWGPDLEGPWCATRPRGKDCCDGRDDYCAVPILGTECYCDIFCNDTAYDCCPDYWKHCHGYRVPATTPRPTTLPPPRPTREYVAPCTKDGATFRVGEIIRDNCNNCTCTVYNQNPPRSQWQCTRNICLLRPELIDAINADPNTIWTAGNYSKLWGLSLDEGIRHRLGTFQLAGNVVDMTPIRVEHDVLPESFDARVKWPNILHPVSDQGNCASSWAHSSAAVLTDRLSIETEGAIKDKLSIQHLLSCDIVGQLGCNGGHLDKAWWFLRQKGVVSEACYPYTSGRTGVSGLCLISDAQVDDRCPSGIVYNTSKRYQAAPPYRIRPLEREIMKEILDNGPVQAIIQVREDFFMYRRGVYKYSRLTSLRRDSEDHMKSGFHSVRIIGWGAERTVQGDIIKYWICANSWGTDWGENGYFRIARGSDESGIESSVIGVWGQVTGDQALRVLLNENRRRRLRVEKARKRRHLRQLRIRGENARTRRNLKHHTEGESKETKKNKSLKKHKQGSTYNIYRRLSGQETHKKQKSENKGKKQKSHHKFNKQNMQQTSKKEMLQKKNKHNEPQIHKSHDKNKHTKNTNLHMHTPNSEEADANKEYVRSIKDKIIYDFPDFTYP